ncbi:MAG: AMP-binding protein [Imperialibacter sp.]|uniref:AMP-binding protein n=1 Tax=Imperialibacter sp. TaxID=2038411 RepID=UPI003A842CE1
MKDYPWFKHYPAGVAKEINPDEYTSLIELLGEAMKKYADQTAFLNMDKGFTYREVDEKSTQFAAYLQKKLGLKKGDRIAIQMPNCLQYPIVMFGAIKAGLVVVNTNPLYTHKEMEHQFKDSGAKAIVIVANFAFNLEKIIANTDIKHVIVTELGDFLKGLKGPIVNFVVKRIKKMVPPFRIPGAVSLKQVMKEGATLQFDKPEIKGEDVAFLQYTGGTTGVSKGATLSHRNMVAHTLQTTQWFQPIFVEGEEVVVITALPLYHIFALAVNGLLMFHVGAKNVLVTNPRDMKAFCADMKKNPFSIITGVNTLFNGLLNQESFKTLDFSKLKGAIGGGMAVQKAVAERWREVTGCPLVEGYGLSETSPVLACNPLDGSHRNGFIGLPVPSTEIILLDDDGKEVPVGQPGEICAKGPQVMSGYWERPDETANVFVDGWFKTGDIGIIDKDGFVKIVDRKKEMILVSGFNVYPNEIEDTVASNPKVLEVGAIGVPDPKSNEAVKIFVVKKDQSLTEEELISFCRESLTRYKVPKHVEFVKELPKSNVGKILRRILKENDAKVNSYN